MIYARKVGVFFNKLFFHDVFSFFSSAPLNAKRRRFKIIWCKHIKKR